MDDIEQAQQLLIGIQIEMQRSLVQIASKSADKAMMLGLTAEHIAYAIGSVATSVIQQLIPTDQSNDQQMMESLVQVIKEGADDKLSLLFGNDPDRLVVIDDAATLQ